MTTATSQLPESELPLHLEKRLEFETLLADLAVRFVNAPAEQIDPEIEHAQRRICDSLGFDASTIWQQSLEDAEVFHLSHAFRPLGGPELPRRFIASDSFPWVQRKIITGAIVYVPDTTNLPPEAVLDQKSWAHYEIKSSLILPLSTGDGHVFGGITFHTTRELKGLPETVVKRLQPLAQVFAGALARQRAERSLSDSEMRLRLAAASANAGLWTLEMDTGHIWATEEISELFGLTSNEGLDLLKFMSVVHPEDREATHHTMEVAMNSGEETRAEYRIVRPDGKVRWIASRGRRRIGMLGEPDRLMGVSVDITEQKHAEAALRDSEERFRLIANTAPVMIWMSGTDKLCTFFNQGWLDFTGRSMEQELGEGWATGVHPDDLERCLKIYLEAFDARADFKMEYRLRRLDGDFRWIVDHGTPRFESDGSFVGYIGSCVDITESKRTQEELQKSYAEVKRLEERLQAESIYLQEEIKDIGRYDEIVGQSAVLHKVLRQVEQVARTNSVVLITGETGTGKELVARAIHNLSKRNDRVMVKVDCAALPSTLIESELFGREKGAYTGALSRQVGRFETADGSTLFLDEIGELGVELQAKLLRVVQDGEFERLGSTKTTHVDVRLIAATHRDLAERVKSGTFREDLFYRLNVFPIRVPPLRERLEDIPLLVMAFTKEFEKKMSKRIRTVPRKTMEELQHYSWPGNIRELRNVIEHAVIVTTGERLNLQLPKAANVPHTPTLKETEYQHILSALERTGWRVKGPNGAAMLLGMKSSTLYTAMRRLQIPNWHQRGGIKS